MNTLSIDGWRKADNDSKSIPIGTLQFYVSEAEHLRLDTTRNRQAVRAHHAHPQRAGRGRWDTRRRIGAHAVGGHRQHGTRTAADGQ